MRRQNAVILSIGDIFQRAGLAYESLTIARPKAVRLPERLRRKVTVVNAPKNAIDRQRSKSKYFTWASDFERSEPPQMFSILPSAGKVSDFETTKVSGDSGAENCLGGGANSSDHNTSPSIREKAGQKCKPRFPFRLENNIVHLSCSP